ncbi:hypothetical protein TSUD_186870 [Trifolium subterraneum]|uniref:Uncharacterized protein n=1 Tax=Trifolium subterraneum TaxID=3900 RepID=A0A2Z6NWY5_TRISU|nr:hypothetical protein TSUD_186870 [Trifolium subterraneum]
MSPTVKALVDIASVRPIEVLCSLIRSIRSPIVDEIESNGEIPKVGMLFLSASNSILFFNYHVKYKRHSIEMKAKEFESYESADYNTWRALDSDTASSTPSMT